MYVLWGQYKTHFSFVLNDGRESPSEMEGFFLTSPQPSPIGRGNLYLLLIGGGGEAGGGFRRESRWGLRELGNELEGAWECPKDEGVAVRVFFLFFNSITVF